MTLHLVSVCRQSDFLLWVSRLCFISAFQNKSTTTFLQLKLSYFYFDRPANKLPSGVPSLWQSLLTLVCSISLTLGLTFCVLLCVVAPHNCASYMTDSMLWQNTDSCLKGETLLILPHFDIHKQHPLNKCKCDLTWFIINITNVQLCERIKQDHPESWRWNPLLRRIWGLNEVTYLELSHETVSPQWIGIIHLQRRAQQQKFIYTVWQMERIQNNMHVLTRKLTCFSNRSDGSMWTL